MKLVNVLMVLAATSAVALLTGCGTLSAYPHPMAVDNGNIMGDVTYPNQVMAHTQFQITSNDFEIIGPVSGHGDTLSILGMVGIGDSGYANLWEAARRLGADEVIGVKVDTRVKSVLRGFIFETTEIQLSGTAIRWKNKVGAPAKN